MKRNHSSNIDKNLLERWLGGSQERLFKLADEAGMSVHTIQDMKYGFYRSRPKALTRRLMCKATGIPEEQLFPFVKEERTATGS